MISAPPRTMQEAFDHMWHAIIKQGVPSFDAYNGICVYAGPNDTACAIGQLFAPEDRSKLGLGAVGDPAFDSRAYCAIKGDVDNKFARACQEAHDRSVTSLVPFIEEFKLRMRKVAKSRGLTVPECG